MHYSQSSTKRGLSANAPTSTAASKDSTNGSATPLASTSPASPGKDKREQRPRQLLLPFALKLQRSQLVDNCFYAQHRPLLEIEAVSKKNKARLGYNSATEPATLDEPTDHSGVYSRSSSNATRPVTSIYTAKSSFFIKVPEEAHIPEFIHTGPLATTLFNRRSEGVNAHTATVEQLGFSGDEIIDIVNDYLDAVQARHALAGSSSWSSRRERSIQRTLQDRTRSQAYYLNRQLLSWMNINSMGFNKTQAVTEYRLTSVLRKRRKKMNKHKRRKLRKRTRALRKRLGK
ncbi:hypothetical protein EV182_003705 [Spiromyces aspiralis]|uniref:Uncharacterized protein n=1 Tax=Spiromyces aspiralis TaxID=68401 RepID=A0ACC1HGJ8_9FUNG|nr:hypothetical protein EV182_003705 [Spiromyces aspiralis]